MDLYFYLKYFAYRRLPSFMHSCIGLKEASKFKRKKLNRKGDKAPSFEAMADHFDELYL